MSRHGHRKRQKQSGVYPEVVIGFGLLLWTYLCRESISDIRPIYAASAGMILLRPCIRHLVNSSRRHRLLAASESAIYHMNGVEFENCCIEHFKKLGYSAQPTPTSGDYGADIILKKGGRKTVVQCKRYKGKVGVSAVQEVIGAKGYYKADSAMVVTNSYFTPNAVNLAKANDVELWDRSQLVKSFKLTP